MRRINTATKGKITDANGKSFDGFVQRDPREGEQSTHLSDNWCNNLQEEICNVIEGVGGQIVSGSDVQVEKYDQMFQAIKLLVDTATPIGSVKAMPIKMSDSYMARWVQAAKTDSGAVYLSQEMAKNCEKVEGDTEGWYKLVTGNKENGEASGAFGWALADGTFPLPISSFGEDDGTIPETEEEKNKRENVISDTEYGKIRSLILNDHDGKKYYFGTNEDKKDWSTLLLSTGYLTRIDNKFDHGFYGIDTVPPPSSDYFLKEGDFFPPEDDTPIDLRIWTTKKTKKPKLIPNLNDKAFLMGSNEENLPFTVEGKNGFMMKHYHMPPHRHDISHDHTATCSYDSGHYHYYDDVGGHSGSSKGVDVCAEGRNLEKGGYYRTDYGGAHGHTITVDNQKKYSEMTGGYRTGRIDSSTGGIQGKNLFGAVPIDLRPKRLSVYYYIRVI